MYHYMHRKPGTQQQTSWLESSDHRDGEDLEDLKLILMVLSNTAFYGYRKDALDLLEGHSHLTEKRVRSITHQFGFYVSSSLGRQNTATSPSRLYCV